MKKHGGRREGAGRKTEDGVRVKKRLVELDDETVKKAKRIGKNNISLGLRTAVREYHE